MIKTREVFDWLRTTFANLPTIITDALTATKNALFGWGRDSISKLGEGVTSIKDWLKNHFGTIVKDAIENGLGYAAGALVGRMYETARNFIIKFAEGLRAASPNLLNDMRWVLDALIGGFNATMDGFKNHVYGVAQGVINRIKDGLASISLAGIMNGALNGLIDGFNRTMDGFKNHVYGVAQGIFNRLKEGFGSVDLVGAAWSSLNKIIDAVNNWSNNAQQHIWVKASEIGRRLMEGLRDGISDMFGAVISKMQEVTNLLPQWLRDRLGIHSPSTVFMEIGHNIMAGLAEGLVQSMALPEMAMASTAGSLTNNSVVNNNNNSGNRIYNFDIQGNQTTGNAVQDVRMLSMLYGGS
ncbi:MAG: hypothetical protein R2867_42100 [Caldilineaceae bacterium]